MADQVAWKSTNSTHESSTLRYGSFGTASYEADSQIWDFLRKEDERIEEDNGNDRLTRNCNLLILAEPEVILSNSSLDYKHFPQTTLKPTWVSNLRTLSNFLETSDIDRDDRTVNSWFSLGEALWLSADGIDSGNLTVPVSAYVVGDHRERLQIACHGRQILDNRLIAQIESPIQVPRILAGSKGSWSNNQTIEQVSFSGDNNNSGGSFLAVRHTSGTSVFQPILKGDPATPSSFIESNILLTIPVTSTGGCRHSDARFASQAQHVLAIVDVEGNWSTWKIIGRRFKSARINYRAKPIASGKLFSWEKCARPAETSLYFDGWHKTVWISGSRDAPEQLLVCNRSDANVFDLRTGSGYSIDLRLDTRKKHASILDAISGPKSGTCYILTTQRILLYNFAKTDWSSRKHPALVCAWSHDRTSDDLTLRLTTLETKSGFKLVLYSSHCSTITTFDIQVHMRGADFVVSSSLSSILSIPRMRSSLISSMTFIQCETSTHTLQSQNTDDVLQVIVQYDDLSISVALAFPKQRVPIATRPPGPGLSLPPSSSTTHHSERYINESDDEADVAGWIIQPQDYQIIEPEPMPCDETTRKAIKRRGIVTKDLGALSESIIRSNPRNAGSRKADLKQVLQTVQSYPEARSPNDKHIEAVLLSDLVGFDWRVDDVDDVAVIHEITSIDEGGKRVWHEFASASLSLDLRMPISYEGLFATYISNLSPAFTSRSRVTRERVVREISFDLCMSTLVSWVQPSQVLRSQIGLEDPQPVSQILSDPILAPEEEEDTPRYRAHTSASQPEFRRTTSLHSVALIPLSVPDTTFENALARLSNFTEVRRPPLETTKNEDVAKEVCSFLSHIPESLDSHPDIYDWQAHEISTSAQKDQLSGLENSTTVRKRGKLARAQKRAELLLPKFKEAVPLISSTNESLNLGVLPIRSWTDATRHHATSDFEIRRGNTSSQPHINAIMSDGLVATEELSQFEGATEQISATQPVKGAFAGRPYPNARGRFKKKRRAGF